MQGEFRYLYGPVYSWRLGKSLGVDPLSCPQKVCNLDCVYCQLGRAPRTTSRRQVFVPTTAVMREILMVPRSIEFEYITFSGRGEPTLAKNLGEMILAVRKIRTEPVAVLTNGTLLYRKDVRKDLVPADYVLAKLDVISQEGMRKIYNVNGEVRYDNIIRGLLSFREEFAGKFALQVMFIARNKSWAEEIARVARLIAPDEVQLSTPLRPSGVRPLRWEDLEEIKKSFAGLPVVSVYDQPTHELEPMNFKAAVRRHGNFRLQVNMRGRYGAAAVRERLKGT